MNGRQSWNDELTHTIIACVIRVHNVLGPGFVERIYRRALLIELRKHGLRVETEKNIPIHYDGHLIGRHLLDLLVEGEVIVELKTCEALSAAHYAQVKSYLKAASLSRALLINFSGDRAQIRRINHSKESD